MKIPTQLEPLDLNLDQWRQDIQTFTASTQNELHQITDSLSSAMAGRPAELGTTHLPTTMKTPQKEAHDNLSVAKEINKKADDRIAKLKQQLAAKTN